MESSSNTPPSCPSLRSLTQTNSVSIAQQFKFSNCEQKPESISTFIHLNSPTMSLQAENIVLSDSEDLNPLVKVVSVGNSPSIENINKSESMLVSDFLEPIADFILTLHRCLQGDVQSCQLEKTIKSLSNSFKNADMNARQLLITQLTNRETKVVPRLLAVMEINGEASFMGAIGEFLYVCLSPLVKAASRQQLTLCLVHCNAGEILFRSLKNLSPAIISKADIGIINCFQVVAKIASKDTKLAMKCRLVGGVKFVHQLIQVNVKNNSLLQALLMVFKFISKNATNQVVLGKDGSVSTLVSLLNEVPKTHWTKIKLILENLYFLTKTKSNSIRLVRDNGLAKVMCILDCWEKIEKRQQVKVLKALLLTLSHLCDTKNGRKALMCLNGAEILHKFVLSCPADQKYEILLSNALNVFLKCASKGELPVASLKGAVTFQIPAREISSHLNSDMRELTPELDQETSDEEDCQEEDDDVAFDLKDIDVTAVYKPHTTQIDELIKMGRFFPEFQNQHLGVSNLSKPAVIVKAPELYLDISSNVKSILKFVKVAYPDMINAQGPSFEEPLYKKTTAMKREKALRTLDRILNVSNYEQKVVFDLDYLLEAETPPIIISHSPSRVTLSNWDEKRIDKNDASVNHLNFESRFESGNLRRVIQVGTYEYDLLLNSDVNSWHHHQWFYFEISNMEAGIPYVFNIINNEKPNSEFNYGMKPVMFSVKECQLGKNWWLRVGDEICYHKNHFVRLPKQNDRFRKGSTRSYYTAALTISFPHDNDVVYLAYHYPYTYTKLQTFLALMEVTPMQDDVYFLNQTLCHTLNENSVPVVTITSNTRKTQEKDVIFLTARVHPGESNSSWMMEGVLRFLLGNSRESKELRNDFVFKIVPMLNPEGVIHGNQRCGLTDEDLNRRWRSPSMYYHPTIYNTKAMIEHLTTVIAKRPRIFCDFHGHSRQKNVFMYGCSRLQSWWPTDKHATDPRDLLLLPRLCQVHMPAFSLRDCRLQVERAKESTARVVVWRQFQVSNSFTIEASTCGCDQGPYMNCHLSPLLLLESGEGFCKALNNLKCDVSSSHDLILSTRFENDKERQPTVDELNSDDELDYDIYGVA